MSVPGAAAERADDVALVMPYARWRRWVRALRARAALVRAAEEGRDRGDRVYLAYGVVLLGLMYGPMLWIVLAQAGAPLGAGDLVVTGADVVAGGRDGLLAVGLASLGAASVLGVLAARAGGPLWTTPHEVAFAMSGQFPARAVLLRRGALLVAGAAGLGAFVGSALAAGALDADAAGGTAADVAAWGVVAALAAQVALAVGVAAQGTRTRAAARVVAAALLAVGALAVAGWLTVERAGQGSGVTCVGGDDVAPALCPVTAGPGTAVLVALLVVAAACVVLVLRVLPDRVDLDATAAAHRRTTLTTQALTAGDASGVRGVLGPERLARRGATFPAAVLRRAPLAARDLLGLTRRPVPLLASVASGVVGGLLVAVGVSGTVVAGVATVAGAALLYAASAVWAGGLRDLAVQPVPGGLLPGSLARVVAGHAVVPAAVGTVVVAAVAAVALGTGLVATGPGAGRAVVGLAVLVTVALGARAWVAGDTTAPVELFTPVAGPTGDMSLLVVAAWYVRGWLLVVGAAWVLLRFGTGAVLPLVLLAGLLVRAAVRRLRSA